MFLITDGLLGDANPYLWKIESFSKKSAVPWIPMHQISKW